MDEVRKDRIINIIKKLLNKINEIQDDNIDLHIELFTYLLSPDAKLFMSIYKKFRATVHTKISKFRKDIIVQDDYNYLAILDKVNKFILQINMEDEFLELKLNE